MQQAVPVECDIPLASALQPQLGAAAYFCDSYRTPLKTPAPDVVEIFFGIFGHHPRWIKAALLLRNRIAGSVGLSVLANTEIMAASRRKSYKAGDVIGPWPIFSVNDAELIAGRDTATWTSGCRFSERKMAVPTLRRLTFGVNSINAVPHGYP